MQVGADPAVLRIAELGRDRVLVLGGIGIEVLGVGLQQRAADAPHQVALRPALLALQALDHHARARRDHVHRDAARLLELRRDQLVERRVVRGVEDHALLRAGEASPAEKRGRAGGDEIVSPVHALLR